MIFYTLFQAEADAEARDAAVVSLSAADTAGDGDGFLSINTSMHELAPSLDFLLSQKDASFHDQPAALLCVRSVDLSPSRVPNINLTYQQKPRPVVTPAEEADAVAAGEE